jgi:hypothetical protein
MGFLDFLKKDSRRPVPPAPESIPSPPVPAIETPLPPAASPTAPPVSQGESIAPWKPPEKPAKPLIDDLPPEWAQASRDLDDGRLGMPRVHPVSAVPGFSEQELNTLSSLSSLPARMQAPQAVTADRLVARPEVRVEPRPALDWTAPVEAPAQPPPAPRAPVQPIVQPQRQPVTAPMLPDVTPAPSAHVPHLDMATPKAPNPFLRDEYIEIPVPQATPEAPAPVRQPRPHAPVKAVEAMATPVAQPRLPAPGKIVEQLATPVAQPRPPASMKIVEEFATPVVQPRHSPHDIPDLAPAMAPAQRPRELYLPATQFVRIGEDVRNIRRKVKTADESLRAVIALEDEVEGAHKTLEQEIDQLQERLIAIDAAVFEE